MSRTMLVIPSALLASALATQAFAQEGKYDAQYCVAGPVQVIAHADGYISGVGTYVGVSPNVFPEQTSWRCTVAWAVIGDQVDSGGTCEFADAAGDKGFGVWSRKGDVQKAGRCVAHGARHRQVRRHEHGRQIHADFRRRLLPAAGRPIGLRHDRSTAGTGHLARRRSGC